MDQIELTLFGPGFGECAVIHTGGHRWIVIDSCLSRVSAGPAALQYLSGLGLEPANCVVLIVATHWHDDHIRGVSALVRACPKATFCCSAALGREEFESMVLAFDGQRMLRGGSGVKEINTVFNILRERPDSPPRLASASKTLLQIPADESGHGRSVRGVALTPSDHEYILAIAAVGKLMPKVRQNQIRCPSERPNLMSVAVHIAVGETSMLLGADLEQHSDARRGWTAVLADTTLPKSRSVIFKVPHHGSQTAFSEEVWHTLLTQTPLAVTTPWVRSRTHLPAAEDIARILKQTPNAFISSRVAAGRSTVSRPPMVKRQLRDMGAKIKRIEAQMGAVRMRNGGNANWNHWTVTLHNDAWQLTRQDAL
ncbi:MAG: MBL fold metallo-hydrolase [Hyphomicrobiaceae bacterium]